MNDSRPTPNQWMLAVAAFSGGLLVLLLPLLTLRVEPKWDALDQFLPAFTYLADSIRQGSFPLWDPYTNCGYPFHAEPQYNTFNPLALALALLVERPALGFVWFWGLHWLWGGIGMIRLARHFGATPAGAVTAAVSYALCGFFVGHAQHTSYILVAAWLPWVFAFADKAVASSSLGFALLAGAAIGLCSFGGYPGLVLFSCLALAIWLCLRYFPNEGEDDPRPLARRGAWVVGTLVVVGVLLLLIWSPKLNAFFLEGHGYTDRVGQLDPDTANLGHPFTLSAAVSLLFPFATTIIGSEWMGADLSMTNGYIGILAIPLAAFWFLKSRGRRRPWWLLAFAGFMLVVSLGGEYGLRNLLYHVFPPMRYMRFSAPFRLFWMLPLTLAAGLAVSHLVRHPEDRPALLKILLIWLVGVGAAAAAFSILAPIPEARPTALLHRLYLPGFSILAAAAFVVWFPARGGGRRRRQLVPVVLAALVCIDMSVHLYNNSWTVWDRADIVEQLEGYHRRSMVVSGSPPPRLAGMPFGPLNAQQVAKVPLVEGYVTMQTEGFNETLCDSPFAQILSGAPRFWLTPGVERPDSPEQALAALARTGAGSPVPVFAKNAPDLPPAARVVPGTFGSVKMLSYAPERVEMLVRVPGSRPAFLASTERYAAGWKVFVNDVQKRVWKTNLYFRGALVPPGTHKVVWKYVPKRWYHLVALSYSALVVSAGAAAFLLWREKRREQD